ncbi:hypothetical protein [Halorubrum lipolyticum]|uniref:Uncharacterized protein n=1 Tax=Halorubrum lipolyticum DSM 21995 TaxID=1227482 RepID=M0P4C9_9EURY|nr:hypothetical protein [Halorubrum lipolyticum]EMA64658.1 hypothetical protein C469_00340 [Halorubrum lipolyticum DSM 21995]
MSESRLHSDGDDEPHPEERDETRAALLEAVEEHETDEIPGGAQVGAVLTTATENVEYRLTFVIETLLQLMAEGALYESADGQLRPTTPELVTDGGDRDEDLERMSKSMERVAEAMELQNALLLQLVQDQRREADRDHHEERSRSDRATATAVADSYGDLYGGSIGSWEFKPVAEQVEQMGDYDG